MMKYRKFTSNADVDFFEAAAFSEEIAQAPEKHVITTRFTGIL